MTSLCLLARLTHEISALHDSGCESATIKAASFDLNAAAQKGSAPKDSKKGMTFANKAVKKDDSLPYWDLTNSYLQRAGGGSLKDGQYYTHAYVMKWRASNSGWRTLLRNNNDHCIIVRSGATDLGMYSNRNAGFRDSGYNVRAHVCVCVCVCVSRNRFAFAVKRCVDGDAAGVFGGWF